MLAPLAANAEEAVGSMGNDTPLAVLSDRKPLLYSYFKQLFAQVTNPPIDSIREAVVMSVRTLVGAERNLLDETPEHARQLVIDDPILSDEELERLRRVDNGVFRAETIDITWPADEGCDGLEPALDRVCEAADAALARGANVLVLSDRGGQAPTRVPIPSLLATARDPPSPRARGDAPAGRARRRVRRAAQRAERRRADRLRRCRGQPVPDARDARRLATRAARARRGARRARSRRSRRACSRRSRRWASRRSRRTAARRSSRRSACRASSSTATSPARRRASAASACVRSPRARSRVTRARIPATPDELLPVVGLYAWRADGEHHQWNPDTIAQLQHAVRDGGWESYEEYSDAVNSDAARPLDDPRPAALPLPGRRRSRSTRSSRPPRS